jgi:2-C-methyl-D-erythritol 4-phosphate cytidylyltransferase
MFRYAILQHAFKQAYGKTITDEAQAIEALGVKPRLVLGSPANIKVTYPEDLELAEAILARRGAR